MKEQRCDADKILTLFSNILKQQVLDKSKGIHLLLYYYYYDNNMFLVMGYFYLNLPGNDISNNLCVIINTDDSSS